MNGGIYVTAGPHATGLDAATGAQRWTRDFTDPANPDFVPGLDDPLWRNGRLLVPSTIYRFGTLFQLALGDGHTIEGGTYGPGSISNLALKDGVLADMNGQAVPNIAVVGVSWKFKAGLIFSLGSGSVGDYAIVGQNILWSLDNSALGFTPSCQLYPDPAPPSIGCQPDWTTPLGGDPTGPAALGDDQVVYADDSGTVTVLDADTGAVLWTAETGAAVYRRPAVADGTILVATNDGRLVAFPAAGCGSSTCSALWEGTLGAAAVAQPVVGGGVVYAAAGSEIRAFALDGCGAPTCASLATLTADSAVSGGPIVHDGQVVAGTTGGHVTAWSLP